MWKQAPAALLPYLVQKTAKQSAAAVMTQIQGAAAAARAAAAD